MSSIRPPLILKDERAPQNTPCLFSLRRKVKGNPARHCLSSSYSIISRVEGQALGSPGQVTRTSKCPIIFFTIILVMGISRGWWWLCSLVKDFHSIVKTLGCKIKRRHVLSFFDDDNKDHQERWPLVIIITVITGKSVLLNRLNGQFSGSGYNNLY